MKAIARFTVCLVLLTISLGAPSALAVNKVLSLDRRGDYVRIGNNPILAPSNLTLEAWFNPTDIRSCHIISRFEDTAQSYEIYLPGDGTVVYQVVGSSGANIGRFHAGKITTNQWQHVAMTYDRSIIKGYLNGIRN